MPNQNHLQITGHLGADPELRTVGSGVSLCTFNVAVSEGKDDKKTTTWFRCQAWKDLAEAIAEKFAKGDAISCAGPIRSREWEDSQGVKKVSWELTVFECSEPVWKRKDKPARQQPRPENSGGSGDDPDVPF